jgi:hypothetical protein
MSVPLDPRDDPEATFNGDVFFDAAEVRRQFIPLSELLARLSRLMQACDGCESVRVIEVTRLERPDETGCNWSSSLVLSTAGVEPEVYVLAYAQAVGTAREAWNLE